jgi:hypothetical protein
MTNTDEDDEFERILRENRMKGQAYHFPEQSKWTGLTEQEQGAIMENLNAYGKNLYEFAQAIEAKLKEKNT